MNKAGSLPFDVVDGRLKTLGSVMLRLPGARGDDIQIAPSTFAKFGRGVDTALLLGPVNEPLRKTLTSNGAGTSVGDFGQVSSDDGLNVCFSASVGCASTCCGGSSATKGLRNSTGGVTAGGFDKASDATSFLMIEVARRRAGETSDCGRILRTACSLGFVDVENLRSSRSGGASELAVMKGCQGSIFGGGLPELGSTRGLSAKLGSKLKL